MTGFPNWDVMRRKHSFTKGSDDSAAAKRCKKHLSSLTNDPEEAVNINMPLESNLDSEKSATAQLEPDDTDDEDDLEVLEENDIPHPKSMQDLDEWLQHCDRQISKIHISMGLEQCKKYHSTKVGRNLSTRRKQELKKKERLRKEREEAENTHHRVKTTGILDFFGPQKQGPEVVSRAVCSDSYAEEDHYLTLECPAADGEVDVCKEQETKETELEGGEGEQGVDSVLGAGVVDLRHLSPPFTMRRVTVEEVESGDEDNADDEAPISMEPAQLSLEAMGEEGLNALPWDLTAETCPRTTDTPPAVELPASTMSQSVVPPTSSIPRDEQMWNTDRQWGFTMPERRKSQQLLSEIPTNMSVDTAVQKLDKILHPRWNMGLGFKQPDIDLVLQARLECMLRFLRLYKSTGYAGWMLHSETIALTSGKIGTKTWLA
ncbi:hypothetical protein B0H17DRAFT_1204149 [Mycena rosella]|uniref:Uncharacterized protein n=1 Tax=Mycena rosella TaxID=1033263 RepID=A0AAD7DAJ0_MYCRO|nr:hypothetical protein B0H17DRAFT_1204149 [Mycena rosella]